MLERHTRCCFVSATLSLRSTLYLPSHNSSVDDRPQRAPYTEGSSVDDWKAYVICGTDTTSQDYKTSSDGVANPDTDPSLPPAKTDSERRGCYHPGIDIERVCNPEGDEVSMPPLSSFGLDRFEVMIGQEELLAGKAWFCFTFLPYCQLGLCQS